MSESAERLQELTEQAAQEREKLAFAVADLRGDIERRARELRVAGLIAAGLAAAGTAVFKLFGRNSFAARIGRYSSGASLVLGLARAAIRLSRFF